MTNSTQKRRKAYRLGYWAEYKAALFLMARGYRIVTMRHKTRLGEIDLIARKGDLICFIEVKARKTVTEAVDSVSQTAKRRIEAAADLWISKQPGAAKFSMRFDIIAICPFKWPVHFENAW